MRVAVYREAHRGTAPADFAGTRDGEIVMLISTVCGNVERRAACGCDRAFSGIDSRQCCSTAVVEERAHDEALAELRRSSLYRSALEDMTPATSIDGEIAVAVEADFLALSELLPVPGRVVRIRNTPDRFDVFDNAGPARPRRSTTTTSWRSRR
jgi:hypothetical protein